MNTLNISFILSLGLGLRVIMIAIGIYIDNNGPISVKYTDIDYNVYFDGAKLMWNSYSPYGRNTFRYPPLISFLLIPNIWIPEFGKILFSLADLGVIYQCYEIIQQKGNNWTLLSWALNPLVASICTRGSLDSVSNYLVLSTLNSIKKGNYIKSGLLYGLVIHLRIYPIIFLPALLLYSFSHTPPPHILNTSNSMIIKEKKGKSSITYDEILIESINSILITLKLWPIQISAIRPTLQFIFSMLLSFFILTGVSYLFYGNIYLQESIFYHFSRLDSRHNFSPYFLWIYLCQINDTCFGGKLLFSVFSTLPQLILFSLTTWTFAQKDLPTCFFLLSYLFVTFNKVCTAQYFTWYACFLPIITTKLNLLHYSTFKQSIYLIVFWILSISIWLHQAHQLEFLGINNFIGIWFGSLLFYIINTLCIAFIIININNSNNINNNININNSGNNIEITK